MANETRTETDSLGEVEVPADALYGAQTQRAVDNFPVSGLRLPRRVIRALALIKKAAAEVNRDDGRAGRQAGRRHHHGRPRGRGRPARRSVRRRHLPDRLGHLQQHERQRGDREPRHPAAGRAARLEEAGPPQRPRQHGAVVERRLPDRGPHRGRRGGRARSAACAAGARGGAGRQGQGLRSHRQDRPHAPDGRGADPPRAGVLRLRADADQRRSGAWGRARRAVGAGAGRHRRRDRAGRRSGVRAQGHRHHQPRDRRSGCARRPTCSRRCRRTTRWSRRRARCARRRSA